MMPSKDGGQSGTSFHGKDSARARSRSRFAIRQAATQAGAQSLRRLTILRHGHPPQTWRSLLMPIFTSIRVGAASRLLMQAPSCAVATGFDAACAVQHMRCTLETSCQTAKAAQTFDQLLFLLRSNRRLLFLFVWSTGRTRPPLGYPVDVGVAEAEGAMAQISPTSTISVREVLAPLLGLDGHILDSRTRN
ncbi:hypothetical protein EJ06DRAFT_198199 [Trichodelitschia bisporula]|uniref:Uncharacterized protein n=1 Tax=Trichodelitschia bisporula TaxID=703511 RepID=A0A6G1I7Q8_9PEZI|nr:hypothetical protein EJ06DRAFT_198199 [Trichodelitschia bisporula]